MKHKTTSSFWACYECLPLDIRNLADKNFQLLKDNPLARYQVPLGNACQ